MSNQQEKYTRVETLFRSGMTVGAYSVEDLAKFVVRSQEKEAA